MKIDKSIPVPPDDKGGRGGKYPFRDLMVGDSIFLPGKEGDRMASAAWVFAHRNKQIGIRTRHVREGGVDGVRVWRFR